MNRILNKIINYGLFFIFMFAINSCAHFKIIDLEKNTSNPSNFYQFLSLEYLEFAKYELYEMKDEIDANHFAYKSSLSINKNKFYPENPKHWNIPNKYIEEANSMYKKINNLITQKAYNKFPEEFSKMLIGYDCWIEQVEENWQLDHIQSCYKKFNKNFKFISKTIVNNTEIEIKTKESYNNNNEKNSDVKKNNNAYEEKFVENTQANKLVVFFEFDKFTLSSNQAIKLETFIKTALENTNMRILIEGHADTMGSKSYNQKLSKKRADFIKKYLMDRSLNNTIETRAFGEKSLLVETTDEVKEKKNRRAELYLQ